MVTFHKLTPDETRASVQRDLAPQSIVEQAGAALGFDDRQVQADLDRSTMFIEQRGETGAGRGRGPARADRPSSMPATGQ